MTLIYPGGGNCDPNEEPCVGPDCIDTSVGDPDNPIDDGCLINCGTTSCKGTDCIGNECVGPDCSYGESGDWHVYWMCDSNNNPSSLGEVVVASDLSGGIMKQLGSQNQHFESSNQGLDMMGSPQIRIGDGFQNNSRSITPFPCFTYLGKKYAASPGEAVANGALYSSVPWSDGRTTNYRIENESCECQGPPDPPQPETGCQDPTACNYSEGVTIHDQATCCYVSGCIDEKAFNYNINSCCDDGSCCYTEGCTDSTALNYSIEACYDNGSCCYITGCTDSTASNYDASACEDDGSCVYGDLYTYGVWCEKVPELRDGKPTGAFTYETFYNQYDTSSNNWGCTDTALIIDANTKAPAIVLPGSQVMIIGRGENSTNTCALFIGTVTGNDVAGPSFDLPLSSTVSIPFKTQGMCPLGLGFTALNSTPFISSTSFDINEPCGDCCDKITDPDCDSKEGGVVGCMDSDADNYDPLATIENNSTCEWLVPRYCFSDNSNVENMYLYGLYTGNYTANMDSNGFLREGTLKDNIVLFQNHLIQLLNLSGSNPSPAIVFKVNNTGENEDYCFVWLGWDTYVGDGSIPFNDTDGYAGGPTLGVIPNHHLNDLYSRISAVDGGCGSCGSYETAQPSGCTDPTSPNYDVFAVIDDKTCGTAVGDVYGCMDPTASNFDINATIEDGSCYMETVTTCDLLTHENTFSHNEPGEFCIAEYASAINLRVNFNSQNGSVAPIASLLNSAMPIGAVITIEAISGPYTGSTAIYETASVPTSAGLSNASGNPNFNNGNTSYVADVQVVNAGGSAALHLLLLEGTNLRYKLCITHPFSEIPFWV